MSFQKEVLSLVSEIPKGKVTTYKQLATALGSPRAYRAVGNALAGNTRPVEIPCHRVVRSDGDIGGYKNGRDKKRSLLESEGVNVIDGKVSLEKYFWEDFEG